MEDNGKVIKQGEPCIGDYELHVISTDKGVVAIQIGFGDLFFSLKTDADGAANLAISLWEAAKTVATHKPE